MILDWRGFIGFLVRSLLEALTPSECCDWFRNSVLRREPYSLFLTYRSWECILFWVVLFQVLVYTREQLSSNDWSFIIPWQGSHWVGVGIWFAIRQETVERARDRSYIFSGDFFRRSNCRLAEHAPYQWLDDAVVFTFIRWCGRWWASRG